MRLHPPTRHRRRRFLLPALAQDQRQHSVFARAQQQPPRCGHVEPRRIAPYVKHHCRKAGAARRLVSRPHRTLQIARLDQRQRRRIKPVLGKARGKQTAAIAAGCGIIDPDDPASAAPRFRRGTRRKPERKPSACADVASQRTAQFMQSATGKSAFQTAVDRSSPQGQLRHQKCSLRRAMRSPRPTVRLQNICRGSQPCKVHVTPDVPVMF